jgi:hypothetical protein
MIILFLLSLNVFVTNFFRQKYLFSHIFEDANVSPVIKGQDFLQMIAGYCIMNHY